MRSDRRIDFLISAACFGAAITGLLGIVVAIVSLGSMNVAAAGAAVLGAGVSFGLLANALLRH
jgi:hypothetical protein